MHSTGLRALTAFAVGFGLAVAATPSHAQLFEGKDAGFPAPEGDAGVLPADSKLMKLFDGGCVLTEGVAAGPDGYMYFSDITFTSLCKDESGKYPQAGNIWKYDPKTGKATVWRSPSGMSNGLKFDKDGNMIAALGADYGGRMLVKTDMETGKSYILSGLYDGKPYNALNDVTHRRAGPDLLLRSALPRPRAGRAARLRGLPPRHRRHGRADHHRWRQDQWRSGLARSEDPLRSVQRQRLA